MRGLSSHCVRKSWKLELKWWTLIGAVNCGVACLQFPLQQNESAVSRIFGLRQVRLYSPENSTHNFLLFGVKIFWEWHLKKKISLIFSWKQLLKVMWCITEPGSKSLLIHKSFVSIFCFVFRKQKWLNEILTKERGQIFAVISGFNEYVWDVGIIFSNYYFVFLGKKKKKCVWRKKLWRHKTIRKNFDDPPSFLTLAT